MTPEEEAIVSSLIKNANVDQYDLTLDEAEAVAALRADRDRLAAEVERLKVGVTGNLKAACNKILADEESTARAERLEAEAGALRNGLVLALRWVVHPKEIDPTLPCATDGEPERELAEARSALSSDAGKRTLAQLDAGRRLAEVVREYLEARKQRQEMIGLRWHADATARCAEAYTRLKSAHETWNRAAAGGGE